LADLHERIDWREHAERIEPTLAAEAIEPAQRNEPAEPRDRIEPTEPSDRIEPVEPIDRIDPFDAMLSSEFCDLIDHREPLPSSMPGIFASPPPAGNAAARWAAKMAPERFYTR
jgi:hypothetical protein